LREKFIWKDGRPKAEDRSSNL